MLKYIAAVATAVTLTITPMIAGARTAQDSRPAKVSARQTSWAAFVQEVRVDQTPKASAAIEGMRPTYRLSIDEQHALKRALFGSVRLLG